MANFGGDDQLAFEIDHVLGLVGQVRAAVLHLRDAGCQSSPVSRRTMLFIAALASSIVLSTPTVVPESSILEERPVDRAVPERSLRANVGLVLPERRLLALEPAAERPMPCARLLVQRLIHRSCQAQVPDLR
jgi:hypothetical protein